MVKISYSTILLKFAQLRPLLQCAKWRPLRRHASSSKLQAQELGSLDDVEIRVIQPADHERISSFLRVHYDRNELPTMQQEAAEEYNLRLIQHGLSLLALRRLHINEDAEWSIFSLSDNPPQLEKVIGAIMAAPKKLNDSLVLLEEARRLKSAKCSEAMRFMACMERDSHVCNQYGVTKALHTKILAVDECLRGQGLGKRLMTELFLLAQKHGYPLVTCDCVNLVSAKLCESLDMDTVSTMYYTDNKDVEEKKVFQAEPTQEHVRTFAKWVW